MEQVLKKAKQDLYRALSSGACECTDTRCCGKWQHLELRPSEFRYSVAHERYLFPNVVVDRERDRLRGRGTTIILGEREAGVAAEQEVARVFSQTPHHEPDTFSGGGGESSGGGASGDY